jgi:hypothetical protein
MHGDTVFPLKYFLAFMIAIGPHLELGFLMKGTRKRSWSFLLL